MLHGVQLISKPNISQNGLIYLARLQSEHQISDGLVFYTYAIASNTQTFTNRPTDEKRPSESG